MAIESEPNIVILLLGNCMKAMSCRQDTGLSFGIGIETNRSRTCCTAALALALASSSSAMADAHVVLGLTDQRLGHCPLGL